LTLPFVNSPYFFLPDRFLSFGSVPVLIDLPPFVASSMVLSRVAPILPAGLWVWRLVCAPFPELVFLVFSFATKEVVRAIFLFLVLDLLQALGEIVRDSDCYLRP